MHHITQSYKRAGDFPRLRDAPRIQYMLATSPRSGSTFVALTLWRTGQLGAPMEYLNFENSGNIVNRLGDGDVIRYWENVKKFRSSPNGIFGFKMFINNYKQLRENYTKLLPLIEPDKVLFLTRKDKIAQAISHLRAMQTGAWFAGVPNPKGEPVYDFKRLLWCYRRAKRQDRQWEKIFSLTQTEPLRLIYEDVLDNPDQAIASVFDAFKIHRDRSVPERLVQLTERQSDALSKEWHERFSTEFELWRKDMSERSGIGKESDKTPCSGASL